MVSQLQNDPVYALSYSYIQGMQYQWASNKTLTISAGQCRDSSNNIDIPLGVSPLNGVATAAPLTINAAINGVNGLDAGSLANNTHYGLYMIADSRYLKPVAGIVTLAANASPALPLGYDSYRLIGYVLTDNSANFLKFYMVGNGSARYIQYDSPIQELSFGAATTFTPVDLSNSIPPTSNFGNVQLYALYIPVGTSSLAEFRPTGATAIWHTIHALVAGANQDEQFQILPLLSAGKPKIDYLVTTSDAISFYVSSYEFYV